MLKPVAWIIQTSKRGDRREAAAQQVVRLVSNSMPVSFSHNAMLYNPSKQRIAYLSAVDQEFWNLEFLTEKIIHMGKVRLPTYTAFQECHGMIMLDKRLISKSSCRHGPLFKLTFVQHLPSVNPTWWRFGTRLVQYSTTPDMLLHHHSTCGITLSCCKWMGKYPWFLDYSIWFRAILTWYIRAGRHFILFPLVPLFILCLDETVVTGRYQRHQRELPWYG